MKIRKMHKERRKIKKDKLDISTESRRHRRRRNTARQSRGKGKAQEKKRESVDLHKIDITHLYVQWVPDKRKVRRN